MPKPSRALTAAVILAAASVSSLHAQQPQRVALTGSEVEVYNLIGTLRVEATTGAAAAEVTFQGADAAKLSLRHEEGRLSVVYPGSQFVYANGSSWETTLRVRDDGSFGDDDSDRGRKVRIHGKGGDGLAAWADVRLFLPRGSSADVNIGVGTVTLVNVDGRIEVETAAGDVDGIGTSGELSIDTGSGDVTLTGHGGELSVDTGSGNIRVANVSGGAVSLDTGSGDVRVDGYAGPSLMVDTGSGNVEVSAAKTDSIGVDTGSGEVSIGLAGDLEHLDVDTGSGDVEIIAPKGLGGRVNLETSGGDLSTDFPIQVTRKSQDTLTGTIGDGRGELSIETGSGSITLRQQT